VTPYVPYRYSGHDDLETSKRDVHGSASRAGVSAGVNSDSESSDSDSGGAPAAHLPCPADGERPADSVKRRHDLTHNSFC